MGIHQGCPQVRKEPGQMNDKINSLRPRFVGKTELRVDVRRIGQSRKIAVTVLTYSPLGVTIAAVDKRALFVATEAARIRGASSTDCTVLHGGEVRCNATDFKGKRRPIRVRSATFYFQAVE